MLQQVFVIIFVQHTNFISTFNVSVSSCSQIPQRKHFSSGRFSLWKCPKHVYVFICQVDMFLKIKTVYFIFPQLAACQDLVHWNGNLFFQGKVTKTVFIQIQVFSD